VTYYVLFFLHLGSRKVPVAGVTPHPHEAWMAQVARNVTMEAWGFLSPGQYLLHDRGTTFCPTFQHIIDDADVECIVLPPRSPNLHAYAERWVRSVKDEALAWLMLFDEGSLQHVLHAYVDHYHQERNHQGKGNSLLFPPPRSEGAADSPMQCRERRGGLLKSYERKAA
jgi:putative transposase